MEDKISSMERVVFTPIGYIETSIKMGFGYDKSAKAVILNSYKIGLKGLEGFSHLIFVFYMHRVHHYELLQRPLRHNPEGEVVGVFATRSPYRPNPIGVSVVKLISIENGSIVFENRDIIDGTPLLDIKPYLPEDLSGLRTGWYVPKRP